jgi:hypothetical protein
MRLGIRRFSTTLACLADSSSPSSGALAGTAAQHTSYILLHSQAPISSFPAKPSSPLQRTLQLHTTPWGGAVNFAWTGKQQQGRHARPSGKTVLDGQADADEAYTVTAFSENGALEIPEVTRGNVAEVAQRLRQHALSPPQAESTSDTRVYLYVCTHGSRDCRCGDTGGAVLRALRAEVDRRGHAVAERVSIAEVAHVGGHKYVRFFRLV